MLYIHKLSQFNQKSADLESLYLIRELWTKTPYPLTTEKVSDYLAGTALSATDYGIVENGSSLLEPTLEEIRQLLLQRDPIHEPINLQRAIQMLKSVSDNLQHNLPFFQDILDRQEQSISEMVAFLNKIPKLSTKEEKISVNQKINEQFQLFLRNREFLFKHDDIVNEAQVAQMSLLAEGMEKGFFIHVTLEEELKKMSYDTLKKRLPPDKVEQIEQIRKKVEIIKKGIDRAYDANLRLVNRAVILYAYVKWLSENKF